MHFLQSVTKTVEGYSDQWTFFPPSLWQRRWRSILINEFFSPLWQRLWNCILINFFFSFFRLWQRLWTITLLEHQKISEITADPQFAVVVYLSMSVLGWFCLRYNCVSQSECHVYVFDTCAILFTHLFMLQAPHPSSSLVLRALKWNQYPGHYAVAAVPPTLHPPPDVSARHLHWKYIKSSLDRYYAKTLYIQFTSPTNLMVSVYI